MIKCEHLKGVIAKNEKLILLLSIVFIYKEKIVIIIIISFDLDRKNQFNSKQIIKIWLSIVICNFLTHSYIVDIL